MILIKRIYEPAAPEDGYRVLVDRLWPRGISKEKIDLWMKDVAPSDGLRKWFSHDPAKWEEFKSRYALELGGKGALVSELVEKAEKGRLTLLFGARDTERNQAIVLKEYLEKKMKS